MLKSRSITFKLAVGIGLIILMLIVVTGAGIWGIVALKTDLNDVVDQLGMDQMILERQIDHLHGVNRLGAYVADQQIKSLNLSKDPMNCRLSKLLYGPMRKRIEERQPSLAPLFKELEGPHSALHASFAAVEKARQAGRQDEVEKIFAQQTFPALTKVEAALSAIRKRISEYGAARKATLDQKLTGIKKLILTAAAIALIFALATAVVLIRSIKGPIRQAVDFTKKLADGDLASRLNADRNDEIGVLVKALNHMAANLQKMFHGIDEGIKTLSETSQTLSAISQEMAQGAEQTSSRANAVAAAAEEMSTNMTSIAAAVEQASANVGMVASSAGEMTTTIGDIAKSTDKASQITQEAVNEANEASEAVHELGKAAQQIGAVTETITEISEQTNLLALNATIEAARAGEAGKGFSVVANEIKELAQQTAQATGEIKRRIESIQTSTEGTVSQISQISKVVHEVNKIVSGIATAVEEQSVTTNEISENVGQASQGIAEVTENVAQSSAVSSEVAQDIAEVGQAAEAITNSGLQVNQSADELSKLAGRLEEMVAKFSV